MAMYAESRGRITEAEPVGLLTEGAAGIAVIVLSVIALAGTSVEVLASIATIVIGVGLMVQAFNSAAEHAKMAAAAGAAGAGQQSIAPTGGVMVDCMCGITGIVLGILALVAINPTHLVPAALIVFGGSLLLSGAMSMADRTAAAAGGMEVLIGLAAVVLGILSLIIVTSWVLVLVGFIAVGAALLLVSASFSGAMMRLLQTS